MPQPEIVYPTREESPPLVFPENAEDIFLEEPGEKSFEPLGGGDEPPDDAKKGRYFFGNFARNIRIIPSNGSYESMPGVILPMKSVWCARGEYFRWNTRKNKSNVEVDEGTLWTLGYTRRVGPERFRAEFFGGGMHYRSMGGVIDPMFSSSSHLGGRGECEYLWTINSDRWPPPVFSLGIGTRIWGRNIHDGTDGSGGFEEGYHQTWWTLYPYAGLEKEWLFDGWGKFYASGRLGCTAMTYLYIHELRQAVYPKPNITALVEAGWRRNHFDLSVHFEAMAWQPSHPFHFHGDPSKDVYVYCGSQMFTVGMQLGWHY